MTYQIKAALIIGFSLCLLVAVVVADHFSAARYAQLEDGTDSGVNGLGGFAAAAAPPSPVVSAPLAGLDPQGSSSPSASRTPFGSVSGVETRSGQDRAGQIESTPRSQEPSAVGRSVPEPIVIANGPSAGSGMSSAGPLAELLSRGEGVRPLMATRPQTLAAPSGRGAEVVRRAPEPVVRSETQTVGSTAAYATYTVRAGDTLSKIARRVLGDAGRWRELQELNKQSLPSADSIVIGQKLRVPANSAAAPDPTPARQARPERRSNPIQRRYYVVKPGDTLGLIAQRELGTVKRQDELLEHNSATIQDADEIYAGMKLELPA
ncbi:MAG: LysM peptidoglycan-binding domain-containing protein [Planctomycetota bacterium]